MDSLGKCPPPCQPATQVLLDRGASTTFTSDPWWQTNGVTFQATSTNTLLEVVSLQPGAMLDSFSVIELPGTSFLPEESLKPFVGENALGEWKLQVVDGRIGPVADLAAANIRWQLEITFAPITVPAVRLTNGVPYTNAIPVGQARYFIVDVPASASHATNTLLGGGPLDLWYHQAGIPTFGASAEDYRLLTNATTGIAVIMTNATQIRATNGTLIANNPLPLLQPGQRYYLAVTNRFATTNFSIQVDFDAIDGVIGGIPELQFGQTITTNIPAGFTPQYYRYVVSTNAVAASFEALPTNGNVQLYLRKAAAVPDPLPTPQKNDYASENPGTDPEIILVTQNSLPVPLSAGTWYLGILNLDPTTVKYSVRVVEYTNFVDKVIELTEGVAQTASVAPGELSRLFFRFTSLGSKPAVQFDLDTLTGRAELLANLGSKPSHNNYEFLDRGAPGLPAKLVIRPGGPLPSLNGDWLLAVYNLELKPISFSIRASYPPAGPIVRALADNVPLRSTIAADMFGLPQELEYFSFTVQPEMTNVTFSLKPLDGSADLLLRQGQLPTVNDFDYVSTAPGLTPDVLVLDVESQPVPLAPGQWFLGVYNTSLYSTTYDIRASALPAGSSGDITINPDVTVVNGVVTFTWTAAPNLKFQVEYATSIPDSGPIVWTRVPGIITSGTNDYSFTDDGSQTGGPAPFKIYRVVRVP
jgi:hypothetical protein